MRGPVSVRTHAKVQSGNLYGDIHIYQGLFAQIQDSRSGDMLHRFSFNVAGGRCESCHGGGTLKVAIRYFLPCLHIPCNVCKGKRYNKETLEIRYKDKNIADVLAMTVSEMLQFLNTIPLIRQSRNT